MNYEQKTKNYFEFFSKKDVSGLESLFSNNIVLRDWEIHAIGKHDVINANTKIFESVNSIKVRPKIIYCVNKTVIAEIDVIINDGDETLLVVDVIEYNSSDKICAIRAYKG